MFLLSASANDDFLSKFQFKLSRGFKTFIDLIISFHSEVKDK